MTPELRLMPPGWASRASWHAKQARLHQLRALVRRYAAEQPAIRLTTQGVLTEPIPDPDELVTARWRALGILCAECDRDVHAHGLCGRHHKRAWREARRLRNIERKAAA